MKSLSCVRLLATPWTAAYQAPLSMGFSRQEYWSGVPWHLPIDSDTIMYICCCYCVVTKSCLILPPYRLQHARLPCPSLFTRVRSDSCPLSCYLTISSSAAPFSICLQSFPTSESFPMSVFYIGGTDFFWLYILIKFNWCVFRQYRPLLFPSLCTCFLKFHSKFILYFSATFYISKIHFYSNPISPMKI